MPHVEIKYSSDLKLDLDSLFESIESTINQLDSSAGVCKSRAYPASIYKHSQVMVDIWLLEKPNRNEIFNEKLLQALQIAVRKYVPVSCYVSLQLSYRDKNYRTIE